MSIIIRCAEESDIAQAAEVDKTCWPPRLCFSQAQLSSIFQTFREGFIVAEAAGHVAGLITSLRIDRDTIIGRYPSWNEVTDSGRIAGAHRPDGNCLFVMAVSVLPFYQHHSLGKRLVNAEVDLARRLPEVKSIFGYTRVPRYHRRADLPIEEYLKLRRPDGRHFDSVLSFHVGNGAKILRCVKGARPNDEESLGYGVLISYDAKLEEGRPDEPRAAEAPPAPATEACLKADPAASALGQPPAPQR